MTRQEKQDLILKLTDLYSSSQFVFMVEMRGVKAADAMNFRSAIRRIGDTCLVAKNTLNQIASSGVNIQGMDSYLSGQVITIFSNNPIEIAKLFSEYENKGYSPIVASDKINILNKEDVKKLASVPDLPVLRSRMLSAILGVNTKIVRILSESAASIARLVSTRTKENN